jgi:hypothetical protein
MQSSIQHLCGLTGPHEFAVLPPNFTVPEECEDNAPGCCYCQRRQCRSWWVRVEEVGNEREDDHGIAPDVDGRAYHWDLEGRLGCGSPAYILLAAFLPVNPARPRCVDLPIQNNEAVTKN